MENCSSEKKTDKKSSATERSIDLVKRANPKKLIFSSTNQSIEEEEEEEEEEETY